MKRFLASALLASALMLSACGDEYEWKLTNTHFPYGNQRTAGSGVIYVLKNMAPKKSIKADIPAAVVKSAGTAAPEPAPVEPKPAAAVPVEDVMPDPSVSEALEKEFHSILAK